MGISESCRAKSVPRPLLLLLAFVNALSPFAFDLYLPALPQVVDDFGVRAELAQQTIAVVLGANAVGIIIFGPLSDRVGRRPILLGGLTVFVLASLACAWATTIHGLIFLRFAQACAVIAARVAVQSIAADAMGGQGLAKFHATLTAITGVAVLVGPLAGASISTVFGWRAIFLVLAVAGAVCVAACSMWVAETRGPDMMLASRRLPLLRELGHLCAMPAVSQITLASAFSGAAYSVYLVNAPTALMELGGMSTGQFALIVSFQGAALLTGRVLNRALLSTFDARRVFHVALWGNLFLTIVALLGAGLGVDLWMAIAPVLLMILIFPMITSNGLALAQDGDRTAPGGVASIFGAASAAIGGVSASIVGAWGADSVAVGFGMVLVSALALAFVRSAR